MKTIKAALFDLDGVVVDTETQYSRFWGKVGDKFHPEIENFGYIIKGNTLNQIFDRYFKDQKEIQKQIKRALAYFETHMQYDFIPGVLAFIDDLQANGVKTAIVTSSNDEKMKNLYTARPEIKDYFDEIITAENISRSKPDPEGYLLGARTFDADPVECCVFEDSFAGLEAGNAAGMTVVGLSTTHPVESICNKAKIVIPDFIDFTYKKLLEIYND